MDILQEILCKILFHNDSKSCNTPNNETILTIGEWFEQMETHYLVLICIGIEMTAIVMLLGILHLFFVIKFISSEQIRTDLYWVVFMAPVIAVCGSLGMILPKVAIFLYAIALVYYMLCLFILVSLMTKLCGSRKTLCDRLLAKGTRISIKVCPLGCCLCCFDEIEPTEMNFRRFEWLVFQSPIVRILLEILNITVFMEINGRSSLFFTLSNLIGIISLLIGSYGSYIIIPAGASLLTHYRFLLLFRIVDISQLLWSVQKLFPDLLGLFDLFLGIGSLKLPSAVAQFYISFLLCMEMLVASLLATWWFRPTECAFFDLFRHRNGQKEFSSSQGSMGPDQQQQQFNQNAGPSAKDSASDDTQSSGLEFHHPNQLQP